MRASPLPAKLVTIYCQLLAKKPGTTFGVMLVLQTLPFLLSIILHLYDYDIFPADFSDVPLILSDDPSYKNTMAWNLRNSDPNEPITQAYTLFDEFYYRHVPSEVTELYYTTVDKSNILTATHLKSVLEFENKLLRAKDYKKFCVVRDHHCLPTRSLARMLEEFLDSSDSSDQKIQEVIKTYYYDSDMHAPLLDFLEHGANVSTQLISATSLRSYIYVAWVITDNMYSQTYNTKDFATDVLHPMLWGAAKRGVLEQDSGLQFFYYNSFLYFDYLRIQVIDDLLLAVGSFLFIFSFVWYQTSSIFISLFGIYGIVTSFFTSNLVYRYILDYRYFGVFHVLAIFIILGIGVDDIFVLIGSWKQVHQSQGTTQEAKISEAYHRASATMFVTSLTTATAFFINGLSPLLAVRSFGLFSGLLVTFNYISVITYFVSALVFYDQSIMKTSFAMCGQFQCTNKQDEQHVGTSFVALNVHMLRKKCQSWYLSVTSKSYAQTLCLLLSALTISILTYSATNIQVDEKEVRLYRSTHFLGRAFAHKKDHFHTSYYEEDDSTKIYLIWGINGVDRKYCHKTDWKMCTGQVVWNDEFDLNPYRAQKDLLNLCETISSLTESEAKQLSIKISDGKLEIACFIQDMENYIQKELRQVLSGTKENQEGLPATDVKVRALMMEVPELYAKSAMVENPWFYRFFETASMYWLHDSYWFMRGKKPSESNTSWDYIPLLGHSLNSDDIQQTTIKNITITYGTRLRYMAIVINSTLHTISDYREGIRVVEQWQTFVKSMTEDLHPNLKNVLIATPSSMEAALGIWHWFKLQETLLWSAIYGILLSLFLTFPVLIVSTDDLRIGFLATLMIAFTTISVIGVIPLAGWKLGVLESLNLTLVVGLAVDYIVHIAEAYHLSELNHRRDKVQDAISRVGGSVVSGAVSTLGASFFMLFAKIVFFMQFGLFIFCTVGFSILYSLLLFVVLLQLVGPENSKYTISKAASRIRSATLIPWQPDRKAVEVQTENMENSERQGQMTDSEAIEIRRVKTTTSIDDDNVSTSGYDSGASAHNYPSTKSKSAMGRLLPVLGPVKVPPGLAATMASLDTEYTSLSGSIEGLNQLRNMTPVESNEVTFYSTNRTPTGSSVNVTNEMETPEPEVVWPTEHNEIQVGK